MKVDVKYTGLYVTMILFGAGLGLLVGSYVASIIESRKEDDDEDIEDEVAEMDEDGSEMPKARFSKKVTNDEAAIEEAAEVVSNYRGQLYREQFEALVDEEDTISTKVDLAIAQYIHNLASDPRATPVHIQMVEQGLVTPEAMVEMLDAMGGDELEEGDYDEDAFWAETEEEGDSRYIILTEKPVDLEPKPKQTNLIYYPEDEILARVTDDGREVNMTDGIPADVLEDAIDIVTWSEGKQSAFIHDTEKNRIYTLAVSKLSLTPAPRVKPKKVEHDSDAEE